MFSCCSSFAFRVVNVKTQVDVLPRERLKRHPAARNERGVQRKARREVHLPEGHAHTSTTQSLCALRSTASLMLDVTGVHHANTGCLRGACFAASLANATI